MRTLRTAIVGFGNAGRDLHAPVVRAHPDLELTAVCDLDASRLASVPDGTRTYSDVDAMLAEVSPDSVHVCTPPATHPAVAEQVLSADVPVLIEKPAAPSVAGVDRIADAAADSAASASVIHNRLWAPFVRGALDRVAAGEIGDVVGVTELFAQPRDLTETDRGDWVFDLPGAEIGEGLVHQAYYPLAFVDGLGEITSVTRQNFAGYDDPIEFDGFVLQGTDRTGDRLVNIEFMTNAPSQDRLFVHGTEGQLEIDFLRYSTYVDDRQISDNSMSAGAFVADNLSVAANHVGNVLREGYETVAGRVGEALGVDDGGVPNRSHYGQIDAHARAIRTGSEPPVSLREARDAVRVLEAVGETRERLAPTQ